MKIIVDAMGGDNAPKEIVAGCFEALKIFDNMKIVLCGDENKIRNAIKSSEKSVDEKICARIKIEDAKEIIENDESPVTAFKTKTNSSIVKAFDLLKKDDADALLSAGSTGAILTGSILKIGRIKGVNRPALAPVLPTKIDGKYVVLLDSGANVDCKPINLAQFAILGNEYCKAFLGVEKPKVALLNVGTEDKKGNELSHQSFELIKGLDINFVGNCEARDAMSGNYDVIVCDGFSGNVLLKSLECGIGTVIFELKKSIKNRFMSKIGAIFMRKTFKDLSKKLDYNSVGGAPFIGVKKLIVKAHGSSKSKSILSAIKQIKRLYDSNYISNISSALSLQEFSSDEVKND